MIGPARYSLDLMRMLPPRGKSKLVVVLEAYMDESGINGTPHCILAGFLASPRKWSRLISQWNSAREAFGAPIFHAKRFFPVAAFKQDYRGWSEQQGMDYAFELANIIRRAGLTRIEVAIDANHFMSLPEADRRWLTGGKLSKHSFKWVLSGAKSKPYFFVFMLCMQRIATATESHLLSNIVMDEQNIYEGHATFLFGRYKEKFPENRLGSLTYGNRAQFPALQAADLLAYLWNSQINRRPSRLEIQVMWLLLNEKKQGIHIWKESTFKHAKVEITKKRLLAGDWTTADFERAIRHLENSQNETQN